jgi:endonuclease/exonuclease/phosphatase family metal-dependent hydrolase
MKKRLFLSLAIVVLVALLCVSIVGCGEDDGQTTDNTQAATDSDVGSGDTEQPPKDLSGYLPLTRGGAPLYTFVYQSMDLIDGVAASDYANTARNMVSNLKKKLDSAEFKVVSDRKLSEIETKVFAVGNVQGVSEEVFADLRFGGYKIAKTGDNLCIGGYISGSLYIASEHFSDAVECIDGELYVKTSVLGETYVGYYKIADMTVGGEAIFDYVISYNKSNLEEAKLLRDLMRDTNGAVVPLVENSNAAKRIVVDDTSFSQGYKVSKDANKLTLCYSKGAGWDMVLHHIESGFDTVTTGSLDLATLEKEYTTESNRSIMSFNVLNVWNKGGTPGTRDDITAEAVLKYAPDFVCLQEFDVPYRNAQNGFISQVSRIYDEVSIDGVIKNDIWNPIFYNKSRYRVIESGFVYFPENTSTSIESENYPAGGTSDNKNARFRSLVWAVLEDTLDGTKFLIGNLHLSVKDTSVSQPGEVALVDKTIKEIAAKYKGCITLVAGDYNSNRNYKEAGTALMLNKGFKDTYDSAVFRNDYASTHKGSAMPSAGYIANAIDHVLTLNDLTVYSYFILTDEKLLTASDHCATVVQFSTDIKS